jgi:iron complex transport system substrate-binding protein
VTSTPIAAGLPGEIDLQVREAAFSGASLFRLNDQRISELAPSLLLTQALCDVCAINENDVRALGARLVPNPAIVTLSGTTFHGVFHDIQTVAAALDLAEAGDVLLANYHTRLDAIDRTLCQGKIVRPRVVMIEWTDPIYLAGHWVPELIARAGGVDALIEAGTHSMVYSIEQIRDASPDILLIAPCGYDVARAVDEAVDLLAGPEWEWARSIPVWAIDANSLTSRPGPRIVEGVETLAPILHPQLFSSPPASHAQRVI